MHATPILAPRQTSTSNSTTTTGDAVPASSSHGLSKTALAIMIPLLVVLAATIIGMVSYFIIHMRRQRRRRAAQRDGQAEGGPYAVGLQMEEGLNELGEAPPPYVGGEGVVKEPTSNEVVEEVFDEPTEPPPAYLTAPATARDEDNTS